MTQVSNATLSEFLLARISEDEGAVRADIVGRRWDNPERVLTDLEAKRRIVMRCSMLLDSWDHVHDGTPELAPFPDVNRRERHHAAETLRDLASVYADHPDYRPEWRP